jgi:hypothetical protein
MESIEADSPREDRLRHPNVGVPARSVMRTRLHLPLSKKERSDVPDERWLMTERVDGRRFPPQRWGTWPGGVIFLDVETHSVENWTNHWARTVESADCINRAGSSMAALCGSAGLVPRDMTCHLVRQAVAFGWAGSGKDSVRRSCLPRGLGQRGRRRRQGGPERWSWPARGRARGPRVVGWPSARLPPNAASRGALSR